MGYPLIEFFHFPNFLQMPNYRRVTLNSSETSLIVLTDQFLYLLSIGHCQFPMTGHYAVHFQGFGSLAELELQLRCTFISSS